MQLLLETRLLPKQDKPSKVKAATPSGRNQLGCLATSRETEPRPRQNQGSVGQGHSGSPTQTTPSHSFPGRRGLDVAHCDLGYCPGQVHTGSEWGAEHTRAPPQAQHTLCAAARTTGPSGRNTEVDPGTPQQGQASCHREPHTFNSQPWPALGTVDTECLAHRTHRSFWICQQQTLSCTPVTRADLPPTLHCDCWHLGLQGTLQPHDGLLMEEKSGPLNRRLRLLPAGLPSAP